MEKVINLMHLARKAGRITFGSAACERTILAGEARLLILSEDLSERSAADMSNLAQSMKVKVRRFGKKNDFGRSFQISGIPMVVGLCYVLIGLIVFLMKPHTRSSWIFFIATALFGIFITFINPLGKN